MLRLAGRAMAELAVQGLLPAQLVLHLSAVAVGFIAGLELVIRLMDAVRRALLPVVSGTLGLLLACLCLIHVFLDVLGVAEPSCGVE